MSTGRICPCVRPEGDSANSLNAVGNNLLSPSSRMQSGKSIQACDIFHTNLLFKCCRVLLKKYLKCYSVQTKDINYWLKTLYGSNVSSTHVMLHTQTHLLVSLYSCLPLYFYLILILPNYHLLFLLP